MIQTRVFCTILVLVFGCAFIVANDTVTPTESSTIRNDAASVSIFPSSKSTSNVITNTAAVQASFTTQVPLVVTPTQSLQSLSSAKQVSTTAPIIISSPVINSTAISVITASPTIAPVVESIVVKDKSGNRCLTALLKITFKVSYLYKNGNKSGVNKTTIPLNGDMKKEVTGQCDKDKADFKIMWNERNTLKKHEFSMNFQNYSKVWTVNNFSVSFDSQDTAAFKHAIVNQTIQMMSKEYPFGNVSSGQAYICNNGQVFETMNVTVNFLKLELQPFSNKTLAKQGKHCDADKSNDDDDDDNTVPIAVGAALGGLVLIVLVAYIIGRRRSTRGYEQV